MVVKRVLVEMKDRQKDRMRTLGEKLVVVMDERQSWPSARCEGDSLSLSLLFNFNFTRQDCREPSL